MVFVHSNLHARTHEVPLEREVGAGFDKKVLVVVTGYCVAILGYGSNASMMCVGHRRVGCIRGRG